MKIDRELKKQIVSIFDSNNGCAVYIHECRGESDLVIAITGADLIFDNLKKLSILLGTKDINIKAVEDGKCGCSYSSDDDNYCYCSAVTEIELYCSGVKWKKI